MPPIQPRENITIGHVAEEYGVRDNTGKLRFVEWAGRPDLGVGGNGMIPWRQNGEDTGQFRQMLHLDLGPRSVEMAHSPATGDPLVSNGYLGADLIRVPAGKGFEPHTHPGDHLLIVVGGQGTITFDGFVYPTHAGQIYMVEGSVPHAVGAITDHAILAVGAPHKPVGSLERMVPVEYREVAATFEDLHCLVCDRKAALPEMLHDVGCEHCPCAACASGKRP